MADLRDIEEVTPNRRQSKHQMIKKGFEFDIYTERLSSLIVPYDDVVAHSIEYDGIRVASLEHLIILKLEAFADRKGSVKGEKDAKDLIRIAAVASARGSALNTSLMLPYLRDEHIALIEIVEKGAYAVVMAHGNAMEAKRIRTTFSTMVAPLKSEAKAANSALTSAPSAPSAPEATHKKTMKVKYP